MCFRCAAPVRINEELDTLWQQARMQATAEWQSTFQAARLAQRERAANRRGLVYAPYNSWQLDVREMNRREKRARKIYCEELGRYFHDHTDRYDHEQLYRTQCDSVNMPRDLKKALEEGQSFNQFDRRAKAMGVESQLPKEGQGKPQWQPTPPWRKEVYSSYSGGASSSSSSQWQSWSEDSWKNWTRGSSTKRDWSGHGWKW